MQILINKQYAMTLFEVPFIAIDSVASKNSLFDHEIQTIDKSFDSFDPNFKMEILDSFHAHEDFEKTFKDLCCKSFEDVMKYYLFQMGLPGTQ